VDIPRFDRSRGRIRILTEGMTLDTDQERRLQELLDKQEITEALLRYCRGMDRCDEELIRSAFHPDAYDDHGTYARRAHDLAAMIVKQKAADTEFTVHRISNHLIEVDGDTAISEAMVCSVQRIVGDKYTQFSGSRFLDRFERRDGRWKIAYRLVVHDWDGSIELGAWRFSAIRAEDFVWGSRGGLDPIMGSRERLYPPLARS
jgi:hypothetical protein